MSRKPSRARSMAATVTPDPIWPGRPVRLNDGYENGSEATIVTRCLEKPGVEALAVLWAAVSSWVWAAFNARSAVFRPKNADVISGLAIEIQGGRHGGHVAAARAFAG